MVPPVSIIPRVLHYMKCQKAVGTIVVPFWPSAHYWPLVTNKYLKYVSAYSMHIGNQSLLSVLFLAFSDTQFMQGMGAPPVFVFNQL